MILSVVKRGDEIILPRNVPRSVINALVLPRAIQAYVNPPLTDRLPLDAVVHRNTYTDYTPEMCIRDRASTVGNMQLYSIIVTTSRELLEQLASLHFNQPAATTAPVLLTFCADIHRFSRWCELRGAEPGYDNFCWFMNGVTDADVYKRQRVLP